MGKTRIPPIRAPCQDKYGAGAGNFGSISVLTTYSILLCVIQASSTTLKSTVKSSAPQESKKKEMVTVTKVFDFAGEKVR